MEVDDKVVPIMERTKLFANTSNNSQTTMLRYFDCYVNIQAKIRGCSVKRYSHNHCRIKM